MALTHSSAKDRQNPITEYYGMIERGEVVVSAKIRKTYQKIVRDLERDDWAWTFDESRAYHAIDFVEKYCKHSKGALGGKPFLLETWQKAMTATVFGFVHVDTGVRKYREVVLMVARKNGKSAWASAIGDYLLFADGEPGPEIYSVATKRDQAKIIWSEAKRMVKKSPALDKRANTLVGEIATPFNDGTFKPLSSDSNTLDGLNVHGALIDELHAIEDKNLYDVVVDGMTAREQPLCVITTTAGTVREGIFDIKYEECERNINSYDDEGDSLNERLIAFIYELDSRSEWTDPAMHQKANPGLGTIKNRTLLNDKVKAAMANPRLVKNLLCKDFNIRETTVESWLTFEELCNPATFDIAEIKPNYGIGGADLSSTTDLTNATAIFKVDGDDTIYALQMYWLPEDLLEQRVAEDKIPYDVWRDMGLLRTTPGNKVHHKYVTEWFIELQQQYDLYLPWIGYDSWSATYWVEEMKNHFGPTSMEPVIQGKKTLSGPMNNLGADLAKKRINYNNNPILKWCLSNTSVDRDKNNNIQPAKGKSERKRIDGMAGLLNAYVTLERHMDEYNAMI